MGYQKNRVVFMQDFSMLEDLLIKQTAEIDALKQQVEDLKSFIAAKDIAATFMAWDAHAVAQESGQQLTALYWLGSWGCEVRGVQ